MKDKYFFIDQQMDFNNPDGTLCMKCEIEQVIKTFQDFMKSNKDSILPEIPMTKNLVLDSDFWERKLK